MASTKKRKFSLADNAMNSKKKETPAMSLEERLALFNEFKGAMKVPADFDAKKELMESLDERMVLQN